MVLLFRCIFVVLTAALIGLQSTSKLYAAAKGTPQAVLLIDTNVDLLAEFGRSVMEEVNSFRARQTHRNISVVSLNSNSNIKDAPPFFASQSSRIDNDFAVGIDVLVIGSFMDIDMFRKVHSPQLNSYNTTVVYVERGWLSYVQQYYIQRNEYLYGTDFETFAEQYTKRVAGMPKYLRSGLNVSRYQEHPIAYLNGQLQHENLVVIDVASLDSCEYNNSGKVQQYGLLTVPSYTQLFMFSLCELFQVVCDESLFKVALTKSNQVESLVNANDLKAKDKHIPQLFVLFSQFAASQQCKFHHDSTHPYKPELTNASSASTGNAPSITSIIPNGTSPIKALYSNLIAEFNKDVSNRDRLAVKSGFGSPQFADVVLLNAYSIDRYIQDYYVALFVDICGTKFNNLSSKWQDSVFDRNPVLPSLLLANRTHKNSLLYEQIDTDLFWHDTYWIDWMNIFLLSNAYLDAYECSFDTANHIKQQLQDSEVVTTPLLHVVIYIAIFIAVFSLLLVGVNYASQHFDLSRYEAEAMALHVQFGV